MGAPLLMSAVDVELIGKRLIVRFRYDYNDVLLVKTITGRRYMPKERCYSVPAKLETARELRQLFGRRMVLGPAMRKWAQQEVKHEKKLLRLQQADDATLLYVPEMLDAAIRGAKLPIRLPKSHPFSKKRKARPYQRADIAFMAMDNCINANDVGTGKTLEAIGAVFEAQLDPKPILIIAPRRSLVNVWQTELERFTGYTVMTSENPAERRGGMNFVAMEYTDGKPWSHGACYALPLIADDIRLMADRRKEDKNVKNDRRVLEEDPLYACNDYRGNPYRFRSIEQSWLFEVDWGAFIIDEFHSTGLNNRRSLFYVAAKLIKAERKWAMSGTPIGGKARRLWAVMNFLYPKVYTSEWNWIEKNLELTEKEVYKRGGHGEKQKVKEVGEIRDEEQFFENHRKHMIRRSKLQALPGLPPEVEVLVETPMLPSQLGDYVTFDRAHEILLDGKRLSGSIVLSQYTRLRQMANAKLNWDRFYTKPIATNISGKLAPLLDKLDEHGIRKRDYEPQARSYVGVIEKSFASVIADELTRAGIDNALLTGETEDSAPILQRFEGGGERPFVIVMTIKTGGSALNLEQANSAHLLDEPWDPDQIHQFFGRGSRGGRTTSLMCYTYRTPGSIQEYIAEVVGHKKLTNKNVLDFVPKIEELRRAK